MVVSVALEACRHPLSNGSMRLFTVPCEMQSGGVGSLETQLIKRIHRTYNQVSVLR